jgi:hypothetical protein
MQHTRYLELRLGEELRALPVARRARDLVMPVLLLPQPRPQRLAFVAQVGLRTHALDNTDGGDREGNERGNMAKMVYQNTTRSLDARSGT